MQVSIIISTYGEDSWADLAQTRAVPSAAAQDAFEVLVGHDPEGTIAGVRNALAANAEGEWLCFLDADDELAPGYLGAMKRALSREQEHGADGVPLLLAPAVGMKGHFYSEKSLEEGNWLVIGTLIERWLFENVGGFGEYPHGYEDWSLWLKASRKGARIVRVPDAVYLRHVNQQSIKSKIWANPRLQVETHNRVLADLCSD